MAFIANHNVSGASGLYHALLTPGDDIRGIKSILLTNTHSDDITVNMFLQDDPSSGTTTTFYILFGMVIPKYTSLLLDDKALLSFNNTINGFGLYTKIGSSDKMDVFINT
jgi:hypothetical protein